jgi:hypothetical protein
MDKCDLCELEATHGTHHVSNGVVFSQSFCKSHYDAQEFSIRREDEN